MTVSVDLRHRFEGFTLAARFEAPAGLTALFGRSGSGKSTVVNAVAGLLRPDHARIEIGGRVLADTERGLWLPPEKRRIGYIFQDARLFPHMSVRQNLDYGRKLAPVPPGRAEFDRVVGMLGLEGLLARRPARLSGGETSRVAIGRALLAGPEMILADEPLAALDEARKAEILPYFERLRDELSIPILYVSHAAGEVARLATSVVAIEAGRVSGQGSAAQILGDPGLTPLGAREAGAMLEARVVAHHADGLSEVQAGGQVLWVPRVDRPEGAALRVHVRAQDVMLALVRPEGISALNVIPAVVRDVRPVGADGALVQLGAGAESTLLARVTARSVAALGLRPGLALFAVLKAVSVARDQAARLD